MLENLFVLRRRTGEKDKAALALTDAKTKPEPIVVNLAREVLIQF